MKDENIGNYLNNHLAGSIAGIELLKRAVEESRKMTELGGWLARFLVEMEEERDMVLRIIKAIGGHEDMIRKFGGWALEKMAASRLDQFTGKSPHLRRLVELEGILLGSQGRAGMWRMLERHLAGDPRVAFADFTFFRDRAETHCRTLERFRDEEAAVAFADVT